MSLKLVWISSKWGNVWTKILDILFWHKVIFPSFARTFADLDEVHSNYSVHSGTFPLISDLFWLSRISKSGFIYKLVQLNTQRSWTTWGANDGENIMESHMLRILIHVYRVLFVRVEYLQYKVLMPSSILSHFVLSSNFICSTLFNFNYCTWISVCPHTMGRGALHHASCPHKLWLYSTDSFFMGVQTLKCIIWRMKGTHDCVQRCWCCWWFSLLMARKLVLLENNI